MSEPLRLVLPVPLAPNRWPKHPYMLHVAKMGYQREAWLAAIQQAKPTRDPPTEVSVTVQFRLCRRRDPDALVPKWPIDALKQKQTGELNWRQGIAHLCGYFYDDGPEYLTLSVSQEKVKTRIEEALWVTISRWRMTA